MGKKLFDFEAEFRLGIEEVDSEHVKLVDMLNQVHELLGAGDKDAARKFFTETLSAYVGEHFAHEEKFMQSIGFPQLEDHRKVHENFKKSFQELKPQIEQADEAAFRKAMSDAFTWIITHIGKTDRKYAAYYFSQPHEAITPNLP
jgi:hemerythrin